MATVMVASTASSPATRSILSLKSTSLFIHDLKNPQPCPKTLKTCFISNPIINQRLISSPPKPLKNTMTHLIPKASLADPTGSATTFHGRCYILKDNIDTDQIIPAEHLTLVPSKLDEYKKLGSLALVGLPSTYTTRFMSPGEYQSKYSIIIAGANFGCGSSREHAPVALGAAGVSAVVAESYARIFFRNSVATGEIYPVESEGRLCDECTTGDVVTVELEECKLVNHTTGKEYRLKPIGDAGPVIEAGGIFAYARKTGMIATAAA